VLLTQNDTVYKFKQKENNVQIKTGSLAFIKKAIREKNIGKIVTCVKPLGHYNRGDTITINGEHWTAIDTGQFWIISGNIETMYGATTQSHIPAHWLSPIEPLPPEDADETGKLLENDLELVD
jgi:hypothetical protein